MNDFKQTVNWGILGTARIAVNAVIPAMQESRNCKAIAIASRDINKARQTALSLSIPHHFGSYEDLLESDLVDAVYIPLPNSLHKRWTMAAAKKKKHILCEKPVALNMRECEEMVSACRKNKVLLFEGYMYRFAPHIVKAIHLVRNGEIGKLSFVRSEFTFKLDDPNDIRLKKSLGGGALYDVGCYCVDFSQMLMGAEPEFVQGNAHLAQRMGVDDVFAGILRFGGGEMALFNCGFQTGLRHSVDIIGERATLHLPAAFEPGFPSGLVKTGATVENIKCESANPYKLMIEHFSDCILGDCEPLYTTADILSTMRTIDRLYKAALKYN